MDKIYNSSLQLTFRSRDFVQKVVFWVFLLYISVLDLELAFETNVLIVA